MSGKLVKFSELRGFLRASLAQIPEHKFFDDLRGLTTYLYWRSFQHLLNFMARQLELSPPPAA